MSTVQVDTINESTTGSGVTVDGVLIKDNAVNTDTISEKTSASGVTIDGVLIKDGQVDGIDVSGITQGITMADQWRLTANATMGSMAYLTANWERNDSTGDGVPFGTGLTESSGQFTFPSTGIYLIHITNTSQAAASFANRFALNVTTDNFSSSSDVCWAYSRNGTASGSTTLQQTSSNSYIFDVTDTSTHKFRINAGVLTAGGTTTLLGSTTIQHTGFSVFRIGDT